MKFNVGDWALFEHKIVQVKKVDDWIEVSDGSFCTSGQLSDRMYPLTLAGKSCADWFEYYYAYLHRKDSRGKLNWPDLSRAITNLWCDTMDTLGDQEATKKAYDKADKFFRDVEDALSSLSEIRVGNLNLFR